MAVGIKMFVGIKKLTIREKRKGHVLKIVTIAKVWKSTGR